MKTIAVLFLTMINLVSALSQQYGFEVEALDGQISEEELLAVVGRIHDQNSTIFIGKKGKLLWIGVKSDSIGVASLCLGDKDRIQVLHASAALGAVTFHRTNEGWTTNEEFRWELRESDMSMESVEKRVEYLKKNGWVANVHGMGNPNFFEFLIANDLSAGAKLAVGIMPIKSPYDIIGLPLQETRGCASGGLVRGSIPPKPLQFEPQGWIDISSQQWNDR